MSAVARILDQEIELVSHFLLLLKQEQDALKTGDPAPLPEIAEKKSRLVDQLNNVENERNRSLGEPYYNQGRNGMAGWLAANPSAADCARRWEKLIELARESRLMHQLNSRLLALHLNRTDEALAVLTRRHAENTLYGSNGQTSQFTGSRIVDSA